MKKTYINKPNSSHYFRIGKALVRIDFNDSGEYTTDNPLWQKAIENSYSFKAGEIQFVTPSMQWIKIDRDENGFATEGCLCKIRKSMPCSLAMKYQSTVVYMSVNNERDFANKYDSIRTQKIITHYLPIPRLIV